MLGPFGKTIFLCKKQGRSGRVLFMFSILSDPRLRGLWCKIIPVGWWNPGHGILFWSIRLELLVKTSVVVLFLRCFLGGWWWNARHGTVFFAVSLWGRWWKFATSFLLRVMKTPKYSPGTQLKQWFKKVSSLVSLISLVNTCKIQL